jgi:hypothetical protein
VTFIRGHEHFSGRRFRKVARAKWPDIPFAAFDGHYVPGADRLARLQSFVEDTLERFRPLRRVLAYNVAVERRST